MLGVLAGIDTKCAVAANSTYPARDDVVTALRRRYLNAGKFNVDESGMVIPRRAVRGRAHARADVLDQTLNTLRVSENTADLCCFIRIAPEHDHVPTLMRLRVAQVPLALANDVFRIGVETGSGKPAYVFRPEPSIYARIPHAASAMEGADLGLTAEVTIDTDGVGIWQGSTSPVGPTWELVGTGPVEPVEADIGASAATTAMPFSDGSGVPVNRAVILHGRSGEVIAVADKMRGYYIEERDLDTYGLPFAKHGRDEGIRAGTKVVVLESHVGRFAVLVCEDLDHLLELGPVLREIGVSHVLNPVVAPELKLYRWQDQAGRALFKDIGARLITANSLAVQRLLASGKGAPTLLIHNGSPPDATQLVANDRAGAQTAAQDAVTVRLGNVDVAKLS